MRPAVILALGLCLLGGCAGSDGPTRAAAGGPTASVTAAAPSYVVDRVRLGSKPCGIQVAGDRVWVSNYGDGTLQWIDRSTGATSKPITVGNQPCGVAVGDGSVWVENYGSNDVTRVDERTGRVLATIAVGTAPYDVAFSSGAAWVTDYTDGTVSRIDAATNKRTVIDVGGQPVGIAPAAGGLWVGGAADDRVVRIDARTSKVTNSVQAGGGSGWTAFTDDSVWVSNGLDGTVTRIDAATSKVVATVTVGPKPLDGVVVDDAAYVPTADGSIYRIDPSSNTVTAKFRSTVGNPFVVSGDNGELWAVDYAGTEAVRIDLSQVQAR